MGATGWSRIGVPEDFAPGALRTVRCGGRQLVCGRTRDGALFALDNRCPHEGYPLAQGQLAGELLTCAWHNWKFRVGDGACVLGGEAVERFPLRERDGAVEVDLTPPDPGVLVPRLLASLGEGLLRHENDRVARDAARLLEAGVRPERLALETALVDARHAEYGTTHALPVAADCCRFLARHGGPDAVVALAPAFDMAGEACRRLPPRTTPEPLSSPTAWSAKGPRALLDAVEREDAALAEGLVRGALIGGTPAAELDAALLDVVSRHFTDFGHQAIYLTKLGWLRERVGDVGRDELADLYGALTFSLVLATREDTLPYWRPYARRLPGDGPELDALVAASGAAGGATRPSGGLRAALLDGSPEEACEALLDTLRAGVALPLVARELVAAAAERLLRFDVAVELDPLVAENWLWATHRFTFASAVRVAVDRAEVDGGACGDATAACLRLVFQAAAFVHSGRAMDVAAGERALPAPLDGADAAGVCERVAAKDAAGALAAARGLLVSGEPGALAALREALEELALDDPAVRPIVVAHVVKTLVAAFDEHEALSATELEPGPGSGELRAAELPLLAIVRFLASPLVERRVAAAARAGVRWVAHGEMPRKLTQ